MFSFPFKTVDVALGDILCSEQCWFFSSFCYRLSRCFVFVGDHLAFLLGGLHGTHGKITTVQIWKIWRSQTSSSAKIHVLHVRGKQHGTVEWWHYHCQGRTYFQPFLTFGTTIAARLKLRLGTSPDMTGIGQGNQKVRKIGFAVQFSFTVLGLWIHNFLRTHAGEGGTVIHKIENFMESCFLKQIFNCIFRFLHKSLPILTMPDMVPGPNFAISNEFMLLTHQRRQAEVG